MGISSSKTGILQPSVELKWKSANRNEPVPCPSCLHSSSFDKLVSRVDFKDYLCKNLDSEYLICSLLDNAHDDKILLSGVGYFRNLNPELRKEFAEAIDNFRKITLAGIDVKLIDTLDIFERELQIRVDAQSSPFLRSFQRRLAVLRGLEKSITEERSLAQGQRSGREYAETSLSSQTYPHLYVLASLHKAGLSFLTAFSVCYPRLTSPVEKNILLSPVLSICKDIIEVHDLMLFSTWAPPPKMPEKALELDAKATKVSSVPGDAYMVLDGSPYTCWTNTGSKGTVTVNLTTPADISSVRVTWSLPIPNSASPSITVHPPPKIVTILTKNTKKNSKFEQIASFDSDTYRKKTPPVTNSTTYNVFASDVTAVQLILCNPSDSPQHIKVYNIEIFTIDKDAKWVDTVAILQDMQVALFPLTTIDEIKTDIFRALVSIGRISGSLGLVLSLVKFIHENHIEIDFKTHASESILNLLKAIHNEDLQVREEIQNSSINTEQILNDVVFDERAKSEDIEITEGGMMIGSNLIGGNAYGLLTCQMEAGVWEWEMTLVQDDHGDETTCLGLGKRPVENCNYTTSTDLWMIRCYSGEPYHGGKLSDTSRRVARPQIHPNDICKFTFDVEEQMVSLAVNDVDHGIVFEHVPKGVSPAVIFYGANKTVRLLAVKRKGGGQPTLPQDLIPPGDIPTLSDVESSTASPTADILNKIANLAHTRSISLEYYSKSNSSKLTSSSSSSSSTLRTLEYPYCIQVNSIILSQLIDLLKLFTNKKPLQSPSLSPSTTTSLLDHNSSSFSSNKETLAILQILDAQFTCLTLSDIDPIHVGFSCVPGSAPAPDTLLSVLASILKSLMNNTTITADNDDTGSDDSNDLSSAVSIAAARVFARGIPIFLSNTCERVELALILVSETMNSTSTSTSISKAASKSILFKMLMKQLSRCEEVLKILSLYKVEVQWRSHIFALVCKLLSSLCIHSDHLSSKGLISDKDTTSSIFDDIEFKHSVNDFLWKFQEQLFFEVISATVPASSISTTSTTNNSNNSNDSNLMEDLLVDYCAKVFSSSVIILKSATAVAVNPSLSSLLLSSMRKSSAIENITKDSLVTLLLNPMLHGLCLCTNHTAMIHNILPYVVNLMKELSSISQESEECQLSLNLIGRKIDRIAQQPGVADVHKGWRTVRAAFEDADPSYTVREGGLLYTAVHSSNTCALVSTGFSNPMRAAWEFLLESDTANDECSVFGAAQMPLSSRCYSSSPDLWMRRAYNGYMYSRGRTTGNTMDKIHPGDVVRVEFDGRAGTLSYSVNGSEPEVAFTDITGEVFPACGSYRSAVQIRLLKVEVYGGMATDDADSSSSRSPSTAHWVIDEELTSSRDPTVLTPSKALDKESEEKDPEKKRTWVTARSDIGAKDGIHDFSFELLERSKVPLAFGVVLGGDPYPRDRLGGACLLDGVKGVWTLPAETDGTATAAVRASSAASSSVEEKDDEDAAFEGFVMDNVVVSIPPMRPFEFSPSLAISVTDLARRVEGRRRSNRTAVQHSPVAVFRNFRSGDTAVVDASPGAGPRGLRSRRDVRVQSDSTTSNGTTSASVSVSKQTGQKQEPPRRLAFSYLQTGVLAMSWCTDGSLWVNGDKRADGFGKHVLPLDKHSCVTLRINRTERTISFLVNGMDVGTAFGPAGSDAAVFHPLPEVITTDAENSSNIVYPAASVSSPAQSLRIRPTGFYGSIVIPTLLFVQKTTASTLGRLCAGLLAGPDIDKKEKMLVPWLRSPLLIGGLERLSQESGRSSLSCWNEKYKECMQSWNLSDAVVGSHHYGDGIGVIGAVKSKAKLPLTQAQRRIIAGAVEIVVFRAEGLKEVINYNNSNSSMTTIGRNDIDPWVRMRLMEGDTLQDSAVTAASIGGGLLPVWDETQSFTLRFDMQSSSQAHMTVQSSLKLHLDVMAFNQNGRLVDDVILGTSIIDIDEVWQRRVTETETSSHLCLPLDPQGVIQIRMSFHDIITYQQKQPHAIDNSDRVEIAKDVKDTSALPTVDNTLTTPTTTTIATTTSTQGDVNDFLAEVATSPVGAVSDMTAGALLTNWLETIDPDPVFLRKALEKTGNYRFPQCEQSFLACLLKHSGLVEEARTAVSVLRNDMQPASPSGDMRSLSKRIRQLRAYLRTQKQRFKARNMESNESPSSTTADKEVVDLKTPTPTTTAVKTPADSEGDGVSSEAKEEIDTDTTHIPLESESVAATVDDVDGVDGTSETKESDIETINTVVTADTTTTSTSSPPPPPVIVAEDEAEVSNIGSASRSDDVEVDVVTTTVRDGTLPSPSQSSPSSHGSVPLEEESETPTSTGVEPGEDMTSLFDSVRPFIEDEMFFPSPRIAWKLQPQDTQSRYNADYCCDILALGIDFSNCLAYILFSAHGDQSLGDLQSPLTSKIIIGHILCGTALSRFQTAVRREIAGFLRFNVCDVTDINTIQTLGIQFQYGLSGYSPVSLVLPTVADIVNNPLEINDFVENRKTLKPTDSFEMFCSRIAARAQFLLKIVPAGSSGLGTGEDSKDILLSLVDKNSDVGGVGGSAANGVNGGIPGAPKLARWRSEDGGGHDRWRRVVEFLRVHSRIRKQASSSSSSSASSLTSYYSANNAGRTGRTRTMGMGAGVAEGDGEGKSSDVLDTIETPRRFGLENPLVPLGSERRLTDSIMDINEEDDGNGDGNDDDGMDIHPSDDISSSQTAMQACAVFIMTESVINSNLGGASGGIGICATPDMFLEVMNRRKQRAEYRVYAMQALQMILSIPTIAEDIFSIQELLLFIRSTFLTSSIYVSSTSDKDKDSNDSSSNSADHHHKSHYLANLEGCSADTLCEVQSAFKHLYSTLSELMATYISTWESSPRFICQSGLLTSLHRLISLEALERGASRWMKIAGEYFDYVNKYPSKKLVQKTWKPWPSSYVQEGLASGTLACRQVLFHLMRIPDEVMTKEEKDSIGMNVKFRLLCAKSDVSFVSLLYESFISVLKNKEELKEKESERKKLADQAAKSKENEERKAWFVSHDIPIFGSTSELKSDDIILEDANQVAYLKSPRPPDFKVACVYCTVLYDVSRGASGTGNYFEVEIVDASQKDIGVGLAVYGIFPVKDEMPGWDTNSFGYHGDDGRKFGFGSTSGIWPLWNVGDVVGCGFDMERRAIFYTLNGELLGDAFNEVSFEKLTPVIGFHSTSGPQKVRINFGVTPMRYEVGTGVAPLQPVVINPAAMEERRRQQRGPLFTSIDDSDGSYTAASSVDALLAAASSSSSSSSTAFEEKTEWIQSEEEKIPEDKDSNNIPSNEQFHSVLAQLDSSLEAATAHLIELNSLRRQAHSMLKFLLTASFTARTDESKDSNRDKSVIITQPSAITIDRAISSYGTPFHKSVLEDGTMMQEWIVNAFIHELLVGAQYLRLCKATDSSTGSSSGDMSSSDKRKEHPISQNYQCALPTSISNGLITISRLSAVEKDRQRHSLSHSESAALGTVSENEVNSDDTTESSSGTKRNNLNTNDNDNIPCTVVEALEVDCILYEHLLFLNGLVASNKLLKDEQLSSKKACEAFFLLLQTGSPRIQQLTASLLSCCLPMITPEDVERRPDAVVRALMSGIREAVRVTSVSCLDMLSLHKDTNETSSSSSFPSSSTSSSSSTSTSSTTAIAAAKTVPSLSHGGIISLLPTPFGMGNLILTSADHYVYLLQKLFEASFWTEIIASNITDSLRNAMQVLTKLEVEVCLNVEDEEDLLNACAACTVLGGLGVLRPGSKVRTAEGTSAYLVSSKDSDDKMTVVFSEHCTASNSNALHNIEAVGSSTIFPVWEGADVDYSALSQPLLPQLILLTKQLLIWFISNKESIESTNTTSTSTSTSTRKDSRREAQYSLLWRLNSLASSALFALLEHQPDAVIDATHDADIMKDILTVSLLPTGLNFFPSLEESTKMWIFCQARILELNSYVSFPFDVPAVKPLKMIQEQLETSKKNNNHPMGILSTELGMVSLRTEVEVDVEEDDSILFSEPQSITGIVGGRSSIEEDKEKKESPCSGSGSGSDKPAGEIGIESSSCSSSILILPDITSDLNPLIPGTLESPSILLHSRAERRRRQAIISLLVAETGHSEDICACILEYFMMDFAAAKRCLLSDKHSMEGVSDTTCTTFANKVEYFDSNVLKNIDYEVLDILPPVDAVTVTATVASSRIPFQRTVERILSRTDNNDISTGSAHYLHTGTLVCISDDEGPCMATSGRTGMSTTPGFISRDMIVTFADDDLGIAFSTSVPADSARLVTAFYETPLRQFPKLLKSLDATTSILRMRQIFSTFMIQRTVNVFEKVESIREVVLLLKLISTSQMDDNLSAAALSSIMPSGKIVKGSSLLSSLFKSLITRGTTTTTSIAAVVSTSTVSTVNSGGTSTASETSQEVVIPSNSNGTTTSNMKSRSPLEENIIDVLVNDVIESFSLLTDISVTIKPGMITSLTSLNRHNNNKDHTSSSATASTASSAATTTEEKDDEDYDILCSSQHPFIAPHTCTGVIDIPNGWKGVVVNFHPKCSTPSALACLKFFKSAKDFADDKASHSFWGEAETGITSTSYSTSTSTSKSCHAFNSMILTGIDSLYYCFDAKIGSDKPPLGMILLEGSMKISKHGVIEVVVAQNKDAIGLGEEDTLFNLFESKNDDNNTDIGENITAVADCPCLRIGTWYFEVNVISIGQGVSLPTKTGIALLGASQKGVQWSDVGNGGCIPVTTGHISDGDGSCGTCVGWFLLADGMWYGGSDGEVRKSIGEWNTGDTIGCLFDIKDNNVDGGSDSGSIARVWFSKNGDVTGCMEGVMDPGGLRPVITMSNNFKLQPNFGDVAFKFPPPKSTSTSASFPGAPSEWTPLLARPVPAPAASNWGYQFRVQPLKDLSVRVSREFDLLWKTTPAVTDTTDARGQTSELYIWRAKSSPEFIVTGDIITRSSVPPRGAILVDRQQCRAPTMFKKVFSSTKLGLSLWRPIPPPGFISLGDLATVPATATAPSTTICMCVPHWAVQCSTVGERVLMNKGDSKTSSCSIWSIQSMLGTFFGSPSEHRYVISCSSKKDKDKDSSSNDIQGIGEGYSLKLPRVQSMITGEWMDESDVLTMPSLSWTCSLLHFLLEDSTTRLKALSQNTFSTLLKYIRSNASPAPLKVIPLLIRMIRLAQSSDITLNLEEVEGLCQSILSTAVGRVHTDKNIQLPDALLGLVDLAVEVQSAVLSSKNKLKMNEISIPIILPEEETKEELIINESKEDINDNNRNTMNNNSTNGNSKDHRDDMTTTIGDITQSVAVAAIVPWWDRSGMKRIDSYKDKDKGTHTDTDTDSLLSSESLIALFTPKEQPVLTKMRNVLEFLSAVGGAGTSSTSSKYDIIDNIQQHKQHPHASRIPKSILTRIWFDYVSLTAFEESDQHQPYSTQPWNKTIFFLGADKLSVTFDRRCSLGTGATLKIIGGGQTWDLRGKDENNWSKTLSIASDKVDIIFEVASENMCDIIDDWGWALVVHASGPVYEIASANVILPDQLAEKLSLLSDNDNIISSENSSLQIKDAMDLESDDILLPPLPPAPVPSHKEAFGFTTKSSTSTSTLSENSAILSIIASHGVVIATGELQIPLVSELEVSINRLHPKKGKDTLTTATATNTTSEDIFYAVAIHYTNSKDGSKSPQEDMFRLTKSMIRTTIFAKNGHVNYTVYGIEGNKLRALEENINNNSNNNKAEEKHSAIEHNTKEIETAAKSHPYDMVLIAEEKEPLPVPISPSPVPVSLPISAAAASPAPEVPSDIEWSCPRCTLINPMDEMRCRVCELPNPIAGATSTASEAIGDGDRDEDDEDMPPSSGAGWLCPRCTYINQIIRD
eukprot:gene974-1892_t